jgi:predicted RNA-binding Zn-ribbon protein involved in translation (DUF1610 family)
VSDMPRAVYGAPPMPGAGRDLIGERAAEIEKAALDAKVRELAERVRAAETIPMRIPCPDCGELHIDEGEFATRPHHTHSCQKCGMTWRPAVVNTVGVRFLPGFKNEPETKK